MSTLDLRPLAPPAPSQSGDPAADVGTIRNWAGLQALPAEVNLEPVAILDHLRESNPAAAVRLRKALDQFPPVGAELAGFDLVAVLGRGTFGRVYLARQGELADRFVALKVSTDLAGESQALARLQHTNIVPIYSAHRAGVFQAVCMPFFGVTTLADLLRRFRGNTAVPATGRQLVDTLKVLNDETAIPSLGPKTGDGLGTGPASLGPAPVAADDPLVRVPAPHGPARAGSALDQLREVTYPDAVCWIGARLADGLEHAHAHGLLHNDLKPANVLLTDEGQPMLLDFGVSEDLRVRVAAPGSPVGGTLPYMAPEHLRSVRDKMPATDARSDVYALGLVLFELLTGAHPFRVPTGRLDDELPRMMAERSGPPPRLRSLNPAVSFGLEAIVRKCLEPDPARRYQSAGDLRDDLDRHRADLPLLHARVPSARERVRKWARRHPKLTSNLSLGTAAVVALSLSVAGLLARDAHIKRVEAVAVAQQEQYGAETAARQVDDDLRAAHYLLSSRPPEPGTLATGAAKCEAALARYGLPADDGWDRRTEFRALSAEEQRKVRAQLTEACLLLARAAALRAKPGDGGDGRLDDAVKANDLAGRLAGGEAPRAVWDQRADLLRRLGKADEAEKSAERAKDTPLQTAQDYYLSGTEALSAGRHRDALKLLRKSVELDPAYFWAHMSLGLCHESLGQYADAAGCYTTAIALWPEHHGGYQGRGTVALQLRDYEKSKADLTRAAELNPDSADVYVNRALAHQWLKEYDAGLKDLDRASELGAARFRVLYMRARMRELAGDKEGAKRDLAEGMKEQPGDDVSWVLRGLARVNSDPAGAVADFDSALAVNPRSLFAMQNKAHALSKLGRNAEAVKSLDRLLELYPDYVRARSGRGVLHARLGNEKAAVADAEESRRRDPGASIAYQVAGIYALLDKTRPGARAEAVRLLSAALRAGFGHEYVESDKDLDPIRETPEFKRVVEGVRALRP